MADFTKLNADIAALSAKVDAQNAHIADLTAQLAAAQPVDEQPAVDAADAEVNAINAKIP